MTLNSPNIHQIIELQEAKRKEDGSYYFSYNRFLSFSLALGSKKQTVLASVVEDLNIQEQEKDLYIQALDELGFLTPEDKKNAKRAKKGVKGKNFEKEIMAIIGHLNKTAGKRFRVTSDTIKKIKSHLGTEEFSVSDFKKVNVYFTRAWSGNPEMKKFIRPSTLYNGKFPVRVEEANEFFDELDRYKKDVHAVCEKLQTIISLEVFTQKKLIASEIEKGDFCDELPLNIQTSIIHWLKRGYSVDQIVQTVEVTAEKWSKKAELAGHISLTKILDQRFPERFNAVQKILAKKEHKRGVISAEEWLKKQEWGNRNVK